MALELGQGQIYLKPVCSLLCEFLFHILTESVIIWHDNCA